MIYCDNVQTILLLTKSDAELNTKLRHVNIHYYWLCQEVQEGRIKIDWIPTSSIAADGLIKALLCQKHKAFIEQLNLVDVKERIEIE